MDGLRRDVDNGAGISEDLDLGCENTPARRTDDDAGPGGEAVVNDRTVAWWLKTRRIPQPSRDGLRSTRRWKAVGGRLGSQEMAIARGAAFIDDAAGWSPAAVFVSYGRKDADWVPRFVRCSSADARAPDGAVDRSPRDRDGRPSRGRQADPSRTGM